MSYERILNFIIRKFKSYLPLGKRLEEIIDGKGEFIGGKGVSGPQKRSEEFHCDVCVTYYVKYFMYIGHVYMYFFIWSLFVNSSSFSFIRLSFFFFIRCYIY